jgi:hypothetical protein
MVVAVVAVGVMEMSLDQVVNVVAVRNRLMTAVSTVLVVGTVTFAVVPFGAVRWIRGIDVELVLVDVVLVNRVQMSVMQVVGVVVVNDRSMAAVLAMLMGVILMNLMLIRH